MVTSVISLLVSLLPSSTSPDAKLVREELSRNSAAAKTNARLPENDINEGAKINEVIVSAAVEHDKAATTVTEEEEDTERETNDAETETADNIEDDTLDNVLVRGLFFESFGCLPIFFVIYWPLFLFLITKICKVAQIAKISPRVAQPMWDVHPQKWHLGQYKFRDRNLANKRDNENTITAIMNAELQSDFYTFAI